MQSNPSTFDMFLKETEPTVSSNQKVTPQGLFDTAALVTAPFPILGDVVGLGADVYRYANQPEERTAGNYALSALGLLPFVPSRAVFKGTIKTVHGSDKPLKDIKNPKDPTLKKQWDEGGVLGESFYSAPSGNYEWFQGGYRRMPDFKYATELEQTFEKAAVLRPDTIVDVLKQAGIKKLNSTIDLKKALEKKGYDGLIIENFPNDLKSINTISTELEKQGKGNAEVFKDLFQNQIASFKPQKNTKIIGEDAVLSPLLKQRNDLDTKINSFYKADQALFLGKRLSSGQMSQREAVKIYGIDEFEKLLDSYDNIYPYLIQKNKVDNAVNQISGVPTPKEEIIDVFAKPFSNSISNSIE